MKRLAGYTHHSKGDLIWVKAKVIGFNVGGQVQVETLPAHYQKQAEAWVAYHDTMAAESWSVRMKRRIATRLWSWAFALSPDDKRAGR